MAVKLKHYTQSEIEYIDRSRNEGKSWKIIAKALKRSENAIYQKHRKYLKANAKTFEVNKEEVKSVSFNVKGIEITMVFK